MGCGASKSADPGVAPAEKEEKRPQKKEDKGPVKKSKLDGADDIGANFDAAAAVTVATGTAALVAGTVSSDARGAMGSAAAAAGQGLLAFAKELPWVAPIAFLIAGVVQASAEVHSLKADAKVFCKNVQSCEAILTEAATKGHLEHVRESVEALQYTVRIRPTFGISPPCPQNLQIYSPSPRPARDPTDDYRVSDPKRRWRRDSRFANGSGCSTSSRSSS